MEKNPPIAKFLIEKLGANQISSQFIPTDTGLSLVDDAIDDIQGDGGGERKREEEGYPIVPDSPSKHGPKNRQREERAFLLKYSKREVELALTVCGLDRAVTGAIGGIEKRLIDTPPADKQRTSDFEKYAYLMRKAFKDDWKVARTNQEEDDNLDLSIMEMQPFASSSQSNPLSTPAFPNPISPKPLQSPKSAKQQMSVYLLEGVLLTQDTCCEYPIFSKKGI